MKNCSVRFPNLGLIVVAAFVWSACRSAPPIEKHAAPTTDTPDAGVDAPASGGEVPDASSTDSATNAGMAGVDKYVVRCVAKEDDVVSFLNSLPESEAQRRYDRARGKSSRGIRIIFEDSPQPGCRSSKFSPLICDWSFLVTGPLFRARYFIDPRRKRIHKVDTLSYDEWCKLQATEAAQWWPAKPDCAGILAQADEDISPGGGDCLPQP